MKIALQNPRFLFADQTRNFDGYNFEFLRQYRPAIYLTGWKAQATRGLRWKRALHEAGLNPAEFEFIFSLRELRRRAEVLLCFNQAACLPANRPPRAFPGLKIWHVMDYNYRPAECYQALQEGGVEYLMGYTHLDRFCPFFAKFYPAYQGRVLAVPFGFGARFQARTPFAERLPRVVAMGAINPVDQGVRGPSPLQEYAEFYRDFPFSQMWRRTLAENETRLSPLMDSFLPKFPEFSRPGDDPVQVLNRYQLFANDDSICHFPPARTYEGPAAGAVMVAPAHPCFTELGFVAGENCLLHRPMDLADFAEQITHYQQRSAELEAIAARGSALVRERYTQAAVAERLHQEIERRWTR